MKEFNVVIAGTGGQGVLTLMRIIAESALNQGYDVKTSELHGLAQRGGPIPCHIRFGEKIYSPIVMEGEAHLIIALEPLEALRSSYYGSKENKTTILVNNYSIIPLSVFVAKEIYPSLDEIVDTLKNFSKTVITLNASGLVKEAVGTVTPTNIYMLGYAVSKGLIPLEKKFVLEGVEENVPKKFLEVNKKVFELGFSGDEILI
ncbi:MAG: indolepyruvate oxidoreductase subunit beta [Candidatus Aenigmarchaeota archaeon]|nr:indolepyruvate oxidoreductase subunit beta [Candidatus Aenigmarchaeota archaeon]